MKWDDEAPERSGSDDSPRPWRRYAVIAAGGLVLLLLGAVAGAVWTERRSGAGATKQAGAGNKTPMLASSPSPGPAAASGKGEEPVEVSLTPDAIERAGIRVTEVKSDASTSVLTVPATVTSNAYRDTKVNALVAGIVRDVSVELGAAVRRGEPLAVIVSSDLADARGHRSWLRWARRVDRSWKR